VGKFVLMMMVVCSEESCELLEEMDHRNTFVLVFSFSVFLLI
jgi:predicted nucleic acid-binding Zn ribbon protein